MRYNIVLLFLLNSVIIQAQQIRGKVIETDTEKPIANVSIYFDGAFKGTVTDSSGSFVLNIGTSNKIPLTVSCMGYYSEKISEYSAGQVFKVYLKPKEYQLDEVVINLDDGMSREEKLRIFKREFLGTSASAKSCEILNENDIRLSFNKKTNTLKAFSDKPIEIHNTYLGYKLSYFLDTFIKAGLSISIRGNFFFEEDTILNKTLNKVIARQREDTYFESRMRFIRSLWNSTIKEDGFKLLWAKGRYQTPKIEPEEMLEVKSDLKYIKGGVTYIILGKGNRQTDLIVEDNTVYIDRNGFYDVGAYWNGTMSAQRIGDLLPFEYYPEKEKKK